jgi:Carboxypeptidase regulatory-like domain/TonB-dependent Receptor Plug Domain
MNIGAILGLMSLAIAVRGQNPGEIQGKLLDEENEPVPFTAITAEQGEHRFSAQSDLDGRFVLKPLPPGVYSVRIVAMNVDRTEEGVIVNPDHITSMGDLVLENKMDLPAIYVERKTWVPKLIDRDHPEVIKVFHTQFKNSPLTKSPVALIEAYAPGVIKSRNGDGLYFRGARAENMCYFVDGVKLGSTLSGLPNKAINSFSVYTGGVPAKYGDVTGGIVAIETKSYFDLYEQRNAGVK